jgi:putative transcriptional regulator
MSNMRYMPLIRYWTVVGYNVYAASTTRKGGMIRVQIDLILKAQGRSFYWLAKETGVSHTTLWRLKKDKAQGITFNTLESICRALGCHPGDVLKVSRNGSNKQRR